MIEFVNFKHLAEDTGQILIDQHVFKEIIKKSKITKEEVTASGEYAFKKWNFLLNLNGDNRSFLIILRTLFNWARYGKYVEYIRDDQVQMRVHHEFGEAWSDFLINYIIGGYNGMFNPKISEANFLRGEDGFTFIMPK